VNGHILPLSLPQLAQCLCLCVCVCVCACMCTCACVCVCHEDAYTRDIHAPAKSYIHI